MLTLVKILAGLVIFDSQDISDSFKTFNKGFQKLAANGHPAMTVQQIIMNTPHGRAFAAGFVWSSDDHDAGRTCLAEIEALGKVLMNTVAPMTVSAYLDSLAAFLPSRVYGTVKAINVGSITDEVAGIIGRNAEKMPPHFGANFSIHGLNGPSATPKANSVFGSRKPHFLLECISQVPEEKYLKDCEEWITTLHKELCESDPDNILPGTYISLTSPESIDLRKIYGTNYEAMMEIKREYDPQNVFNLAIPKV